MDVALHVFYMNNKAFLFFRVRVVVFNATFNNISVISWDSVFLVKDLLFRYLVALSIKSKKKPSIYHKILNKCYVPYKITNASTA